MGTQSQTRCTGSEPGSLLCEITSHFESIFLKHCTGSEPGLDRMTVRTAQPVRRSRQTDQQTNQQLIHPWTAVIAILEGQQLIQGLKKTFKLIPNTLKGATIVETILGDALVARLVGFRTAG